MLQNRPRKRGRNRQNEKPRLNEDTTLRTTPESLFSFSLAFFLFLSLLLFPKSLMWSWIAGTDEDEDNPPSPDPSNPDTQPQPTEPSPQPDALIPKPIPENEPWSEEELSVCDSSASASMIFAVFFELLFLSSSQKKAFLLQKLGPRSSLVNDVMLLRFIRGYRQEADPLEKTWEMLDHCLVRIIVPCFSRFSLIFTTCAFSQQNWRASVHADQLLHQRIPYYADFRSRWPEHTHGFDREGHPIFYVCLVRVKLNLTLHTLCFFVSSSNKLLELLRISWSISPKIRSGRCTYSSWRNWILCSFLLFLSLSFFGVCFFNCFCEIERPLNPQSSGVGFTSTASFWMFAELEFGSLALASMLLSRLSLTLVCFSWFSPVVHSD